MTFGVASPDRKTSAINRVKVDGSCVSPNHDVARNLQDEIRTTFSPDLPLGKGSSPLFSPNSPYRKALSLYSRRKYTSLARTAPPCEENRPYNSSCSTCASLYGIRRSGPASSIYDQPPSILRMTSHSIFQLTKKIPSMKGRSEEIKSKALGHFSSSIILGTSLLHSNREHSDHSLSQLDLIQTSIDLLREDAGGEVTDCIKSKLLSLKIPFEREIGLTICLDLINGREKAMSIAGFKVTHPHSWLKISTDEKYENSFVCSFANEGEFSSIENFIKKCHLFVYQNQEIVSMYGKVHLTAIQENDRIVSVKLRSLEVDAPFTAETKDSISYKMINFFSGNLETA